jgi:CBS domain containing-hemolysin-like protein
MLHVVLRPLHWFFETLSTFTLRCLGHGEVPVTPLTEEELKLVLMDSHEEGVLTEGEARPLLLREKSNAVCERAARPPIKIPVDLPQDGILRLLQEGRGHLGIVRDRDDQKTLGIVTLEDVLESLVGDVREAPRGESPPC